MNALNSVVVEFLQTSISLHLVYDIFSNSSNQQHVNIIKNNQATSRTGGIMRSSQRLKTLIRQTDFSIHYSQEQQSHFLMT